MRGIDKWAHGICDIVEKRAAELKREEEDLVLKKSKVSDCDCV